jgi:octaprenyl-diphosphate synthase
LNLNSIAPDLEATEQILSEAIEPYREHFGDLVEHLHHYRGKRLRPMLMLLTAEACGGIVADHHTLAAAVEMIHTATLVHDDVLDDATTRRHVATVNAKWGNRMSILLGDLLFSKAFHLTSQVDRAACEWIGDATNRVCAGELRQVREGGNLHLREADYFSIIDGKTAALTEVAARLGALYAGAEPATAERLANYGRCLGLAFQIADDLLDLTGSEAKTGKSLGTDLEQQKLTLPVIHCLQTLPSTEAHELRATIRKGGFPARGEVAAALSRCRSVEYAQRKAAELVDQAIRELAALPPSDARHTLEAIVAWSIRRDQ